MTAHNAQSVMAITECGGTVDVQVCDLDVAPDLLPGDILTIGGFEATLAQAGDLVLFLEGEHPKLRRIHRVITSDEDRVAIEVEGLTARRLPKIASRGRILGMGLRATREGRPVPLRGPARLSLAGRAWHWLQSLNAEHPAHR